LLTKRNGDIIGVKTFGFRKTTLIFIFVVD